MPGSPSLTPRRSLAVKRSAPSDGFQASPVPSKLRNVRGIPRQSIADSKSLAAAASSTIARRTRRGSRFASVTTASGAFEDDGSFLYERHGSVGLGSDYGARHQAPKHGLRRGTVLAKDQVFKASATGDTPVDVWNLMQSFDANKDVSTTIAYIDPIVGWALLSTLTATYVWNHSKRTASASPTCYTFSHDKSSRRTKLPFTALVPHGHGSAGGSEPGLLFVYPSTGRIVCWDRVGMVLANAAARAGAKGRVEAGVELADGEVVTTLTSVERDLFLLSTSNNRVFRLSLSQFSGQPAITLKPFEISTRKIFIASSSSPYLFSLSTTAADGIKCITVGEAVSGSKGLVRGLGGDAVRDVWLLTATHCQRWSVTAESQKMQAQYSLRQILLNSAALDGTAAAGRAVHVLFEAGAMAESLELLDIAALANGRLAVLASYSAESDAKVTSFAVIVLREDAMMTDNMVVENSVLLDYCENDLLAVPSLTVSKHGRMAFVKFARAVVICSLAEGLPYQQVAFLRDGKANAFIGSGSALDADPTLRHASHSGVNEVAQFYTFLPQSGILCLEASIDDLLAVGQNAEVFKPNAQLKTRIEQAVFFSDPKNPLTFDLQPGFSGSIETAALQLSESIVSSSYSDHSPSGDMAQEFEKRLYWLGEISSFLRRNQVMWQISHEARQRLLVDLQIVSCGAGLWTFLNAKGRLSMLGSGNYLSFLGDAILEWAEEHGGTAPHEDVVRSFFKHNLTSLPDVLHRARQMLQIRTERQTAIVALSEWQLGVNEAFLIAFEAALIDDMTDRLEQYEVDPVKAMSTRLWLTDETSVEDLRYVYSHSIELLEARKVQLGSAIDGAMDAEDEATIDQQQKQQVLKDQISRMIYPLCYALEARARYAAHQLEQQPDPQAALLYHERYLEDVQEAIVALTSIDVDLAYHIAEHHQHYATLVYLTTHDKFGNRDRLEQYMQGHIGRAADERSYRRHASRFAQELYSMYYKQGRYYELINQKREYYHLLSDFFRRQGVPELAWMHLIDMQKYDQAGEALMQAALNESRSHGQKIMLSISKLSLKVDEYSRSEEQMDSQSRQQTLGLIEDRLELAARTEHLVEIILDVGRPASTLHQQSTEKVVQRYMSTKCQNLANYPNHIELFENIAKEAVSGQAITHEDLADLLSLKDNAEEEVEDYVEAIQVCRVIPKEGTSSTRQSTCLRSLWRRIWLHDDWAAIADTSGQTDEEVQERRTATAAYRLIVASREDRIPAEYMLAPEVAAIAPTEAELRARFGPVADIQGLLEEQIAEAERLQQLCKEGFFADFLASNQA
ncbi:hypothetical protein NliqN6_1854 [Naganishia liquefaciens]|uniref:Nucleoporin Nup133/Nup155-like N-terminal domain-containing protein n=1 Tax=Naganishia liquefaciens TaxID=104408 RepID=A0A8H3YEP3_9TREE|nr:hypothetical protein NliqN6_1854 [Naganishia liquefaciens]